jgi:Cu-processing system permease protein
MKALVIIAINTFREIIRDRILYGILVFALLLIGLSLALGQLSFAEQSRISADFGFTGIHLSAEILAIFIGSSIVAREIEKRTIMTLLVRPLSRTQFILGKFLGLGLVLSVLVIGLSVVLEGVIKSLDVPLQLNFLAAVFGIWIESLILLSLALFFGSFAGPVMTVIFTGSMFLLGHWVSSLPFFVEKSQSAEFKSMARVISTVVPNLETLNWRSAPVYGTEIKLAVLSQATLYALAWIFFLLSATALIFRRRDFV